jgi:type III secretion protein L
MTTVIKARDTAAIPGRIRPIVDARSAPDRAPTLEPVIPAEVLALRREVDGLRQDIKARDAQIERLREEVRQAYRQGESAGREAGLAERDARRDEALKRIEGGIDRAVAAFEAQLAALDDLAVLVAREALGKMLGDPDKHMTLLAQAIRHQLRRVDTESIIGVFVSQADYPDADALAALASAIGRAVDLRAVETLAAGACHIKLTLGALEIGLNDQWRRLEAALLGLSDAEAAP